MLVYLMNSDYWSENLYDLYVGGVDVKNEILTILNIGNLDILYTYIDQYYWSYLICA